MKIEAKKMLILAILSLALTFCESTEQEESSSEEGNTCLIGESKINSCELE